MRKLFLVTFIIAAMCSVGLAQQEQQMSQQNAASSQMDDSIPNKGVAPKVPNGIGRLDLRVVDENGNPVKGVRADLESIRTDGFFCEALNTLTDARGVAVIPPLHMGRLTLKLKASGYETQKVKIIASTLNEPVRVTMIRKK